MTYVHFSGLELYFLKKDRVFLLFVYNRWHLFGGPAKEVPPAERRS